MAVLPRPGRPSVGRSGKNREKSGMKRLVLTAVLVVAAIVPATTGVLLTGCAMSKETYLPDGRLGHSISCDGSAVGINVCFEKAGELCKGRGYDLVSREGQVVPFGTASGNQYGGSAVVSSLNTKSILVACK
jgi:hypothetical protein